MFKVVEVPTAKLAGIFNTHEEAMNFIENIASSEKYPELLAYYGSERRVQQELIVEPV